MKFKALIAASLVAVAALVAPAIASAHHVVHIGVVADCQGYRGEAVINVFGGHSYRVTAPGFDTGFKTEYGDNHNVTVQYSGTAREGTVSVTIYNGANGTGGVEAHAYSSFENTEYCTTLVTPVAPKLFHHRGCGSVDVVTVAPQPEGVSFQRVKKGDTVTVTFSSTFGYRFPEGTQTVYVFHITHAKPCPPPPPHFAPRASFVGPCGDPMYRVVLNNARSQAAVTFRFSYVKYGVGRVVMVKTVAAGRVFKSSYVHVLGSTRMYVYASHAGLVASERSAPGGNYRACV